MEFKNWLEHDDVDPEKEKMARDSLNMTAGVPIRSDGPAMNQIANLTRGFHLNTVIGRMLLPWTNTLTSRNWQVKLAPGLRDEDGKPNRNFMAAYDLFKDEIAKAVNSLPFKSGRDVRTGKIVDVLGPVKKFLAGYGGESGDYIACLERALDICLKVFPPESFSSVILQQSDNFRNFLELVRDEFMTFGERLPRLGEDPLEMNRDEAKKINRAIEKYESMRNKAFSGLYG